MNDDRSSEMPVFLESEDHRILSVLQHRGRITNTELADEVAMSTSPCWRRVRRLEDEGVIRGYRAVVDRKRVGFGVMAFMNVQLDRHSEAEQLRFQEEVTKIPQVVGCYVIAGNSDFLLQVVARDLEDYSSFAITKIGRLPGIRAMNTSFVLKELTSPGVLPLDEL